MGGSSEKVTVGYKYYVGMHMALCHGHVDKIVRIRVGGKKAWVGNNTGGALTIDKAGLFGGEKREGGVSGRVDIEMGAPGQAQNSYLAAKLGGSLLPAFRGVCCAVLRQVYIGLNPYLKDWGWFAQRLWTRSGSVEQWYKSKVAIGYYEFVDTIPPMYQEQESSLNDYDIVVPAGSLADVFSLTSYGIRHDPTKQAVGSAKARWKGSVEWSVGSVEFSFMLHTKVSIHDAAVFILTDAAGANVIVFYPYEGMNSGRPSVNGYDVTSFQLDALEWYSAKIEQTAANVITMSISLAGSVVGSVAFPGSITPTRGYYFELSFTYSAFMARSSVSYGEVLIRQYLHTPGEDRYGSCSDMNPAHIIRECLTDSTWGMGYAESDIDDTAFMAAADALFAEEMGISILWSQQTSIEDFVGEILRHIDATIYVDRTTGKFVLKLIRDDYDTSSLPVLDQSNISRVEGYTKQTIAELINEITISYDSNKTGQVETITLQNLAMIQMQGAVIPSSVEYMGFANEATALKAVARDLKALSTPLVSATIYANRKAAGLNIGDCFVWDWVEEDEAGDGVETSYVMRVTEIALGDGVENIVRVQCVQDVFSLPDITYVEAEPTEWTDPSAAPLPATPRLVVETPYYEIVRQLGEVDAAAKLTSLPELGYLMVAAGRAAAEINAELQVDSGAGYVEGGTLDFCPCAALDGAIGHLDTTAALTGGVDLDEVADGSLAQIGDEIIVIESITDDVATIRRGCLDTIPATHADGAPVIIWDGYTVGDNREYVDSDELDVKILTVTGQGPLAIADAPVDSVVMDQRALRPYPPADVKIGGSYYPAMIVADDLVGIVATWVHRDRTQQTGGTVLGWTDASVGPETGVTYSARLVRTDTETELDSDTGISAATVTFVPAYRGEVRLEVWSVRDGLASMQNFEHTFSYIDVAPVYYSTEPVYYDGEGVYYEL